MRIIAKFEKGDAVRYVSHLDIQRLFQRAFRRAAIPLAYSQGFNPHPLLSFATALSVGCTSGSEWLDIKLEQSMDPAEFMRRVNAALPEGVRVTEALEAADDLPALSGLMAAAAYTLTLESDASLKADIARLLDTPILVEKRTKAGMRTVSIRPQIYKMQQEGAQLHILGRLDAGGSLPIDLLMAALMELTGPFTYMTRRDTIYSLDGRVMPKLPEEYSQGASL